MEEKLIADYHGSSVLLLQNKELRKGEDTIPMTKVRKFNGLSHEDFWVKTSSLNNQRKAPIPSGNR
jgi:hypothetical protein